MPVSASSAVVFLAGSSAAKMGVSVSAASSVASSPGCPHVVDIDDFLKEEIKGPAQFSCETGSGCKFEEPAMNDLIDSVFGDPYITLNCAGGECLHFSQV